jgi:hypothetical protein
MKNPVGRTARILSGAAVVFLVALLAAPAAAQETVTTIVQDGSARTTYGESEHTTPAGPGPQPPASPMGTITPIGPFAGEKSEGFDTQVIGDPFPACVEDRVFNDQADLCSTGECAHITPGWIFSCTIFPHDTPMLYGSCSGWSVYTFDEPIVRFGGYFGSNASGPPPATASFYDADDNLIGTVDVTIAPNCAWTWGGWELSGSPATRVEVVGSDTWGGAFVMMDDMEIVFADDGGGGGVPATTDVGVWVLLALVLATSGLFLIAGRRKSAQR